MEDLPLGRIAALVPELAVRDLALGRTLMMMICRYDLDIAANVYYIPLCGEYSSSSK